MMRCWDSHGEEWPCDSSDAPCPCLSPCSDVTVWFCLIRVSSCTEGSAQLQLRCKDKELLFRPPCEVVSEKSTSPQASTIQPWCAQGARSGGLTAVEFLWMDARGRSNSHICPTQGKGQTIHSLPTTIKTIFSPFFFDRKKNIILNDTMKG